MVAPPPPPVKSYGPFAKKNIIFSHLACVFVEFVCSHRTQLLHIFELHYFIL